MHNIIVWLLHTQFHAHHQESSFPPSLCSAVYLAWRLLCPTKYGYTHPLWAVIWSIIFHSFTLSLCPSLGQRWVSWGQHRLVSCFLIYLTTVCLFIGELHPFTFRLIVDKWRFSSAIYLLFSGCYVSPLFLSFFFNFILFLNFT